VLTPDDLKHAGRKSGYRYVAYRPERGRMPYHGQQNGATGKGLGSGWMGPWRATAAEAAQDAADYLNGTFSATPAAPAYPAVSVDLGTNTRHAPKVAPVKIIRREFKGPHDLYDVLVYSANGDLVCRKVGITARGAKRYEDICRTFGLSVRPVCKDVTYTTKALALKAETAKVAEVASDPAWRQVAKEAFAPVKKEDIAS
jgi:hypothetical protein